MSFGHCSCPDCGTTLRIRDRTFVGRQVSCPECRIALVIELGHDDILSARKLPNGNPSKSPLPLKSVVTNDGPAAPTWVDGLRRLISSPLVLAWALALAMTTLAVVAMLRPAVRFRSPGSSVRPQDADRSPAVPETIRAEHDAAQHPSLELPSPSDPPADATTPANVSEPLSVSLTDAQQTDMESVVKPVETIAVKPFPSVSPVPRPLPKIDFDAVLKQRLLSFDQAKPVSRRELIELMEEMLGVPIRYDVDELGEKNLDKLVTFKMENTTVGGILKSILDSADWEFVTEDAQIRVKLKPSDRSPPK